MFLKMRWTLEEEIRNKRPFMTRCNLILYLIPSKSSLSNNIYLYWQSLVLFYVKAFIGRSIDIVSNQNYGKDMYSSHCPSSFFRASQICRVSLLGITHEHHEHDEHRKHTERMRAQLIFLKYTPVKHFYF